VTTRSEMVFSNDRSGAIEAINSTSAGRGWCNVTRVVVEDVAQLKVNFFGLWVNKGVAVATFVPSVARHGVAQPSSLGLLHSRGRLGVERINELLDGAPYIIRQDHSQRGLLLDVPEDEPAERVVNVMCTVTDALCDYEATDDWRLTLFLIA
jgi:hypothetical protein